MNIVKENIDDLNAVLKVKIVPADYQERYTNALKKHQKKMQMPGFRPGKVPFDMVKKRFGKQVLFEEINDMISDSLHKYIYENNMEILGNPLPKADNRMDLDNPAEFEFQYDLGLAPKMNIELSANQKYSYYTIQPDDTLINKHIDYFRRNYGKVIQPEVSEDKDILVGDFVEVDSQGDVVPGGFFKNTLIDIAKITNAENKKKLIGLKVEDKIILSNLMEDAAYIFEILAILSEKLKDIFLQFRLKTLSRIVQAEVNQDLYDRIYGAGKVNSEQEFKDKIREELSVMFVSDSDQRFFNEVVESLMKNANLSLPEEFLKRFLLATKKISAENVDKEFNSYSGALKWQLLQNYLLKTYKIAVTTGEAEKFVTDVVKMNLARHGRQDATEEEVKIYVQKGMEDEKQLRGVYDKLYEQKLIDLFKNTFTLEKKDITYDEFFPNHPH